MIAGDNASLVVSSCIMGQYRVPTSIPSGAPVTDSDAVESARKLFYDPTRFTLADMVRFGTALRTLVGASTSMEQAAQKTTRYIYDNLRSRDSGSRSCVLVRLFKTHPYGRLNPYLQQAAVSMASSSTVTKDTKCLTLLGTSGDEPQWNSHYESRMHRSVPLISPAMVEQVPMISELVRQLGLPITDFLKPTPEIIRDLEQTSFGVFHVPTAVGNPCVPAQKEFVVPFGIRSAIGFGGILPDGELFAVIIFARVTIPASTAEMFRTIALSLKLGLLSLLDRPVFAD